MIRARGHYRDRKLELEQPLDLAEGTVVEIEIRPTGEDPEKSDWCELGMSRLEQDWDNPQDAIYDDWKKLYGLPGG